MPTFDAETIARHAEAVRRLARRLVWDQDRAEDVAQDALVLALERQEPPHKGLGPWIRGVTRKLAANTQRRERRLRERHARAGRPASAPAPDDVIERLHAQRLVGDALMAVGEPYRRTLYMRYFEELPPRTIAEQLGLPVNTVRTHLRRGRAKLRAEIAARSDKRGPWHASLVPLLAPRVPTSIPVAASAAGLGGTLLMLASFRYAVVLLFVLLVGSGVAYVTLDGSSDDDAPSTERGQVSPRVEAPVLKGAGTRTPAGERTAQVPATPPLSSAAAEALPVLLEGRVLDPEGRALAGVPVKVYGALDPTRSIAGTESNAQGRFEIRFDAAIVREAQGSEHPSQTMCVAASHPRWLFAAVTIGVGMQQEPAAWRTRRDIELRFQEAFSVDCRVLDEAGRPIPDAICRWGGNGEYTPRPDGRLYQAVTDAEGRAKLELPVVDQLMEITLRTTGQRHVHVEAQGYARGVSRPIRILQPTPGQVLEIEVVLQESHTIAGHVMDDRGIPVLDLAFDVTLNRPGVPSLYWNEQLGRGPRTDASGNFTLENVPPGPWTLDVWAPGYEELEMPIEVPSPDLSLELARKTTIEVHYLRPDGTPLRAGLYHAVRQGGRPFSPYGHARGRVPLLIDRLVPGRYRITVNLIGRVPPFVHDLEVVAGPNDAKTITVPAAEGSTVRGRLLDAQGEPVAGRVVLSPQEAEQAAGTPPLEIAVGMQGAFRFEGLSAGSYLLWAIAEGHAPMEQSLEVTEAGSEPIDVRLGRGTTVRVRLPHRPPSAAFQWQLQVRTACAGTLEVLTTEPDEDGWLELPTLPVGTTTVLLESTSFRADPIPSDTYVAVLDGLEGETVEHEFPREAGVTLVGRVLGADGKPCAQHSLSLYRVAPDFDLARGTQYSSWSSKDVFTDDEGRFEAQGLVPGRYMAVTVRRGGVPVAFEVTGDARQTVELRGR